MYIQYVLHYAYKCKQVCMIVCMYYVRTHGYEYECMYACMYVCMYECLYVCVYVCSISIVKLILFHMMAVKLSLLPELCRPRHKPLQLIHSN